MTPFGPYELLALLARGGIAEIWLARQRGLAGFEKLVVLKRLHARLEKDPEYVDMFLDEARINARLQHSNVLSVYELGQVEQHYFLAMEYIEGMPLGALAQKTVARLSDVPIAITGGLLVQAASGLHYAHEATDSDGRPLRVVHRDLSPLNLLVSFDGVLKVADFGIAKADGRRARTKTGSVKGTPTYMSPEQVSGGLVDRRSDIFGLGILLWELLTSRRLFKRPTAEETYDAIMTGPIPQPSTYRLELPSALDALTLRALARRPEDRFDTAAQFADELERALHRDGLRAEAVDVRAFLAKHFVAERAEHEALLSRLRAGEGATAAEQPLFKNAEHGLDSGDDRVGATPFLDDDTARDSAPTEVLLRDTTPMERAAIADIATTLPSAPALPSAKKGAPTPRPVPSWLIALAVFAAVAAALMLGVLAGRAHP